MNCEYCRLPFDGSLKFPVKTVCNHKICYECVMRVKKRNGSNCPEHDDKKINPNHLTPDEICQEHLLKVMHFCHDHMVKSCSSCADHKSCKGKINYNVGTFNENLNKVIESKRVEINSLGNLDLNFNSIQDFIDVYEQGIEEFEYILRDLVEAKNFQRKEKKQKTLNMYSNITANLLSKEHEQTSLYEKIIKPEEKNLLKSSSDSELINEGIEDGFPNNENQNNQISEEILNLYKKLGNSIIRLFYDLDYFENEVGCRCIFFFTHDLADSVEISGMGIGKSIGGDFSDLIGLEITVNEKIVAHLDEGIYPHETEGIVYDLKFDKFELKRNQSCCVNIHVGGSLIIVFKAQIGGPVNIVNADDSPLDGGCPILYFILDQPYK